MNQVAINLNNRGVQELARGDTTSAFTSLNKAAKIAMNLIENHNHNHNHRHTKEAAAATSSYQFHWTNHCESISSSSSSNHSKGGGAGCSTPFLFLRALFISSSSSPSSPLSPSEQEQDQNQEQDECPCGYAWAIWFNLALCCSVLGTRLGEKGRLFLEMANDLYLRVQRRVDSETTTSNSTNSAAAAAAPHWQMLAMAISNNQACLFYDLSMQQATMECLHKLATTLKSCQETLHFEDRGDFCLNLQILQSSHTIAAAA